MERPESLHDAKPSYILSGLVLYGGLSGVLLLMAGVCTLAVIKNQTDGKPLLAVLASFISLAFFLGAVGAWNACQRRLRWPTEIAVCFTGLRWRQRRKRRAILWAEVQEVVRDVKLVPRHNNMGLLGAIAQANNPQPPIRIDTLQITLSNGETYRMSPSSVTDYQQFAGTVGKLWSDGMKNSDFSGVTQAWMSAMGEDNKPSVLRI